MAKQHKIGKVVVFMNCIRNTRFLEDVTPGKPYVIEGYDDEGAEYFTDDAGQNNFSASTEKGNKGSGVYVVGKLKGDIN